MRRAAIGAGLIFLVVFLGFLPAFLDPIVIRIVLPGWWPLAGLCVGLWGLYLMTVYYTPAIVTWIDAIQTWLHGE